MFVESKGSMPAKKMEELFPDSLFTEERPEVPALNGDFLSYVRSVI